MGRLNNEEEFEEDPEIIFELVDNEAQMFQINVNQTLLDQAILIASQSFFWRFYSTETKLNKIQTAFEGLSDLIGLD